MTDQSIPSWAISYESMSFNGFTMWKCKKARWDKNSNGKRKKRVKAGNSLPMIHAAKLYYKGDYWLSEEFIDCHNWLAENMPEYVDQYYAGRKKSYQERLERRSNNDE